MAEHERRFGPGRRRDGGEILILPLRRERPGVAAVTPAAAVIASGGITAQTVLNRVLGSLRPGEIVLMHCGSNPDDHSTLDAVALPSVIQALQARRYSFVTLDALRTPGNWGDEVNPFGSGFDVFG